MKKNLLYKTILIIAVLLVFLFGIFGIPKSLSGDGLKTAVLDHVKLGLDLKGGTHLILQVQVNDAVRADGERAIERLKEATQKANLAVGNIAMPDPTNHPETVVVQNVPTDASSNFRTIVSDNLPEYDANSGAQNAWTITMKPQSLSALKQQAVSQAIETIRNRIDQLGVTEPTIQEHGLGDYQILVELPGVDDPGRVKEIMQSTAMLEIRQSFGGPYNTEQEAVQAAGGTIPPDRMVMPGKIQARGNEPATMGFYIVSRTAAVSGRDLRNAEPTADENGRPAVRFVLSGEGGRRFAAFTGAHVGEALAVILDNKVQEVATIQEQIHDEGRITNIGDQQRAKDVSMILRSGALPASITYLSENTVGPSLGADSIRAGVRAAVIGMAAVLIFMLVYYKGAGINADLGLILNLVILLGFLGFSGATLTLPGIAGVILTVGMGVDSNVLIFERIREELRLGKTPSQAVDQGFAHAWITIVDTHVTTIVSAFILFLFGTGPVRGFATTLTFGLLANLFTSVFVSRVIFDAILTRKQRGEALSI
jgi:preprotein translocase subunit SecD